MTQTIQQKSSEWYTPSRYIEAAREVMGGIDLDPASCELANRTVKATRYYTKEENGLMQPWYGRVWCNPPYGKTEQGGASYLEAFTRRLMVFYFAGDVIEAILLIPVNTATSWFDLLWQFPICMPKKRIRFHSPESSQKDDAAFPTCFVYLGPNEDRFIETFCKFGRIVCAIDTPRLKPIARELWDSEVTA